jgi:hypothetical protein
MRQIIVQVSAAGAKKTIRLPAMLKPNSAITINTGIAYKAEIAYRATAVKAVLVE